MKNRPRLRRARPLLIAGAALSTLAVTGCPGPFGNLRAIDCDLGHCAPTPDMAVPDAGFGNLRAPLDMTPPEQD